MLPASNRGAGMNMGFPDVCLTPAAPAPIPVPYPNMAMNAQAAPFAATVMVCKMPALNMGSKIPMTMGDEGGSAHPTFKGMGAYTMGNPKVLIEKLPAINLSCPTTGNMMNNPIGMVAVPSAVNVFYTDRRWHDHRSASATSQSDAIAQLRNTTRSAELVFATLPANVLYVQLPVMSRDAAARLYSRVKKAGQFPSAMILDLRGNPGGELRALLELADDWLAAGADIVTLAETDGDSTTYSSQHDAVYDGPLAVLIDEKTASAAELLAGALKVHRRALVVGRRSYGKGSVQAVGRSAAGLSGPGAICDARPVLARRR